MRKFKLVAIIGAATLLLGAVLVQPAIEAHEAAYAIDRTLISAGSTSDLAASANALAFPSGNKTAVVVPSSPSVLVAQGSALAGRLSVPLVVSPSTTTPAGLISQLKTLRTKSAILLGAAKSFSKAFVKVLKKSIKVKPSIAIDDDFTRSVSIAKLATLGRLVVVDTRNQNDLAIGTNYAGVDGYGLILTDGTQATTKAANKFFAKYKGKTIYLLGDAQSMSTSIAESEIDHVEFVATTDAVQAGADLSSRASAQGNAANVVYVAPADQLGSIAVTATLAHQKHATALTAGSSSAITTNSSAKTYLSLWASETRSVTLVGTNLTADSATSVASPTLIQRDPAPGFRVTNVQPGASTWALSYTARDGAASYDAYDIYGTHLARSTTPQLILPNPESAVLIVASDANAQEIDRLDFRMNQYSEASDQQSAMIGTTSGGTNYLQFLGSLKTPRVITRVETDPFVEYPTPITTVLAITCNSYYADTGQDATKQYEYDVSTQSGSANVACDPAAPLNPRSTTVLTASKIVLPPTSFPISTLRSPRAPVRDLQAKSTRAATPTTTDRELMLATHTSTPKASAMNDLAFGSTGAANAYAAPFPDYVIRYQGFIPEKYVPLPDLPTGDFTHTQLALGGDDRPEHSHNPIGSYRFRMDIFFNFSVGTVSMLPDIGVSHLYKCVWDMTNCIQVSQGQQSKTTLTMPASTMNSNGASATLHVDTWMPLLPLTPAINANLVISLKPGHSTIIGYHERMPVHEIYGGLAQSEFSATPIYQSESHFVYCLFGALPTCTVNVNVAP